MCTTSHACRIDEPGGVPCDQRDLGAPLGRDAGHRIALLARAAVADESHGIDRLAGTACRDEHLDPGQFVRKPIRPVEQQLSERGDLLGPGSRPAPLSEPVRRPEAGSSTRAPAAQRRDVRHGGRVEPHLGVHGGREHHRTPRGEQRGGQQVVCPTWNGARQQVGRGRCDDTRSASWPSARAAPRRRRRRPPVAPADRTVPRTSRRRRTSGRTRWGPRGRSDPPRRADGPPCTPCRRRYPRRRQRRRVCARSCLLFAREAHRPAGRASPRPRCARAGRRGSRASRSTAASPAAPARRAGRRTRGCRHRAGCSSR